MIIRARVCHAMVSDGLTLTRRPGGRKVSFCWISRYPDTGYRLAYHDICWEHPVIMIAHVGIRKFIRNAAFNGITSHKCE